MKTLKYIRHYPFSIMALCNIIGDLCYLGFAFAAVGWVRPPKLMGALFTIGAHIILIAYADSQKFDHVSADDYAGRALVWFRKISRRLVEKMPQKILRILRHKPVGIGFAMLSLNGLGLLIDATEPPLSVASLSQMILGSCVMAGCTAFSFADYAKGQKMTDCLLKIAPTILMAATLSNVVLASTTHNIFMIIACIVFLMANLAGFYTKIDKSVAVTG